MFVDGARGLLLLFGGAPPLFFEDFLVSRLFKMDSISEVTVASLSELLLSMSISEMAAAASVALDLEA